MDVLMKLGSFTFGATTAAYQAFRRATAWRWAEQERMERAPAMQWLGKGGDTIELTGVIAPGVIGGAQSLDDLRALADQGQPLMLVAAPDAQGGFVHGRYVIRRIEETGKHLAPDGTPRRIEFRLELAAYGDDTTGGQA